MKFELLENLKIAYIATISDLPWIGLLMAFSIQYNRATLTRTLNDLTSDWNWNTGAINDFFADHSYHGEFHLNLKNIYLKNLKAI